MEKNVTLVAHLISSLDGVSFHLQAPIGVPTAGVQWTVLAGKNGEEKNLWPLPGIKQCKPNP